jgi:SAM-dependent methyltransferase
MLPIAAGEVFDVVVCQQGLQFVPDKSAAAGEMRRVLAAGGRLAVATWRPAEEIPMFRELQRVAERHLGPIVDARHSFGESEPLERLLVDAGFHHVEVETLSRVTRFEDGSLFLRLNTMAIVGMSAAAKAMPDEERARVVGAIMADSASVLPPFTDNQGLACEILTNVATAKG